MELIKRNLLHPYGLCYRNKPSLISELSRYSHTADKKKLWAHSGNQTKF